MLTPISREIRQEPKAIAAMLPSRLRSEWCQQDARFGPDDLDLLSISAVALLVAVLIVAVVVIEEALVVEKVLAVVEVLIVSDLLIVNWLSWSSWSKWKL